MKVIERVKPNWRNRLMADGILTSQDPEMMSGAICVKKIRFPVADIFENLDDGMTLDEIFENYSLEGREDQVRKIVEKYYQ